MSYGNVGSVAVVQAVAVTMTVDMFRCGAREREQIPIRRRVLPVPSEKKKTSKEYDKVEKDPCFGGFVHFVQEPLFYRGWSTRLNSRYRKSESLKKMLVGQLIMSYRKN